MADTHKNFAKGTLTNSPGTAGTSFVLSSGEGANFAANMPVTIVQANTQPDGSNAEIGYVTDVATDTLTVTRAQQSTTAQNAVAGWQVLGTITAKALTDIEADVAGKADSVHTHTASQVTDFDTEVSNNTDVAANSTARHTHANQAVLDATSASFTTADETKLDGIAAGATANSSDATLLNRANHTGTQAQSTITNLTTDLATKVTGVNTDTITVSDTEPATPAEGDIWINPAATPPATVTDADTVDGYHASSTPTANTIPVLNATSQLPIAARVHESYSTSEVNTGATWVDGKTIYKKTINFGALPNNTSKSVAHGISSRDNFITISGFAKNTSSGDVVPLPRAHPVASATHDLYATSTNVIVTTASDRTAWNAYVTLTYTKV